MTQAERGEEERERGKVERQGKDINSEMRHMDGTKSVKKEEKELMGKIKKTLYLFVCVILPKYPWARQETVECC